MNISIGGHERRLPRENSRKLSSECMFEVQWPAEQPLKSVQLHPCPWQAPGSTCWRYLSASNLYRIGDSAACTFADPQQIGSALFDESEAGRVGLVVLACEIAELQEERETDSGRGRRFHRRPDFWPRCFLAGPAVSVIL